MCKYEPAKILELALHDPKVRKLRHDLGNRETALSLSAQLLDRMTDPTKREALRERVLEQSHEMGVAFSAYRAALHDAFVKYESSEYEETAEQKDQGAESNSASASRRRFISDTVTEGR